MQDCFRLHPEVYGEELADDEADADSAAGAQSPTEGSPETANAQAATTEATRPAPAEKSSRPDAANPKKAKTSADGELPKDVRDTASPE